ncbi:hypothetical protein [Priestia megaterium]|uniref:hypothetical protein n=1 Tax=Priestia megaterium TaxID=1404 RepID=UPI002FFF30B7
MLKNADFALIKELTPEQHEITFKFIDVLFSEDLSSFWNMISDIDKSRFYGLYEANKYHDSDIVLTEFLKDIREDIRDVYVKVRKNTGLSTTVRYTREGEMYLYLFENVKEVEVYTEATEKVVYPLILTSERHIENEQFFETLRVRIYDDAFRNVDL